MEQNELLQAILNRLDSIESQTSKIPAIESRLDSVEETLQTVKNSQIRVELEQFPRIAAALDGHKLNSEKLDDIKKNLEEITPTVQALDILHQTGYAQ